MDTQEVAGTLAISATAAPGILFIHGWGGSQQRDLKRAQAIAALGATCLTFDLRGHASDAAQRKTVTREDSLRDTLAAYDFLTAHPSVDRSAVAVVGSSYGGYLATILSTLRQVRWLALRAPALYRDKEWDRPKWELDKEDLSEFRRQPPDSRDNRALSACAAFDGDVLIVESEHDVMIPHPTIVTYVAACRNVRSLTYRVIAGADHALSNETCRETYDQLLVNWITEMVLGARGRAMKAGQP